MNKALLDFETTGLLHNSAAEIVEVFILITDENYNKIDSIELIVQVNSWSVEAEAVHKISKKDSDKGLTKVQACKELNIFFEKYFPFCAYMYVNPIGSVYYDCAVLRLLYFDAGMLYDYYRWFSLDRIISAYTVAKESLKSLGYKGKSFKQEAVYEWLFSKNYQSHRAKDDVMAMRDILIQLENNQTSLL